MPVDRKLWDKKFISLPPWLCPTCQSGTLTCSTEDLSVKETELSRAEHQEDYWEPEYISERFSAFMNCQNPRCRQMVLIGGITEHRLDYGYDFEGNTTTDVARFLIPKFAYPPPPMFLRHELFPDDINDQLGSAFGLFWIDLNACANRFRTVVDTFLKLQGYQAPENLHSRLLEFQKKNEEVAVMLLSIKWIGNEGSHSAHGNFTRDDLFHASEVLEFVLEETYLGRKSKLLEKANEINTKYSLKPPKHNK